MTYSSHFNHNSKKTLIDKMKISVFIIAGAQAFANRGHVQMEWICGNRNPQPCDFNEWFVDNWWSSAVESFNFVSQNWDEFTDTVKSVSMRDHF